jgi:hypothetical protein
MKFFLMLTALLFFSNAGYASSFVGFGFTIKKEDKASLVQVIGLIKNGPAERAGVRVGEFLVSVDGKTTVGLELDEVSSLLKGEVGTSADLELQTGQDGPTRLVTVQRELITIDCFLEGSVRLDVRLTNNDSGWATGWIGNEHVRLDIWGRRATGYIKNQYVSLSFDNWGGPSQPNGRIEISGYIKNTFVRYTGWNGYINGYQNCIP